MFHALNYVLLQVVSVSWLCKSSLGEMHILKLQFTFMALQKYKLLTFLIGYYAFRF